MKNYTKKPFNLEYMKAHPETQLVTRDGREVTEWHYLKSVTGDYPTIAVIGGGGIAYTKEGFYYESKREHPNDLFILVPCEEKVFYANLYKKRYGSSYYSIEETKKNANKNATHIIKITTSEGNPPTFEIVHTY